MATIEINEVPHYYEISGEGLPLVFVHGGFVDSGMWDPQFNHFSNSFRVLRYDLRGHGKTGSSAHKTYSMDTFADDLDVLLEALEIEKPILCGLSLGGMVAQAYVVKHPRKLRALILADTAVSVSLTLMDKLQRYVFFPRWAMQLTIGMLSAENFTRFSFWLARAMRSEGWIGADELTRAYVEQAMTKMKTEEYLKVYRGIYEFKQLPLGRIQCPTLVLNGEHESRSVFRHTEEILRQIPHAEAHNIPGAGHTSNLENPQAFSAHLELFLARLEEALS